MRSHTWMLVIILLAVPMVSAQVDDSEYHWRLHQQDPGDWTVPDCGSVTGTNTVTFTTDEGLTLAQTQDPESNAYTYGLATLDVGNTLLASVSNLNGASILRSQDAGCRWAQVALLPVNELLLLTAAPGGMAYGWSHGRNTFYRIEGNDVVTLAAPTDIYGLAVDPTDAAHIRIGTSDCQLYESFDGGTSLAPLGGPANSGSTTVIFTVEFDPADFDHALCGAKGAYRTADAGQSWNTIAPFDFDDVDLVYLFEFSPAETRRVWARANLDTVANRSTEILMSDDGGATFVSAIVQGERVYDQNGIERIVMLSKQPAMAAHPDDPDILYFEWTTVTCCPPEKPGTNLCRHDASVDQLDVVHIEGLDGIDALAFNPVDADVMYIGLERESLSLD